MMGIKTMKPLNGVRCKGKMPPIDTVVRKNGDGFRAFHSPCGVLTHLHTSAFLCCIQIASHKESAGTLLARKKRGLGAPLLVYSTHIHFLLPENYIRWSARYI